MQCVNYLHPSFNENAKCRYNLISRNAIYTDFRLNYAEVWYRMSTLVLIILCMYKGRLGVQRYGIR